MATNAYNRRWRRLRAKAKRLGIEAAERGDKLETNPYPLLTERSVAWLVGYAIKLAEIFNNGT